MASAAGGPAYSGVSPIDIRGIPATTHLFFDDKIEHVDNVNAAITQHNTTHVGDPIDLVSICCVVSGGVDLVNAEDMKIRVNTFKDYCVQKNKAFKGPAFNFFDNRYAIYMPTDRIGASIPLPQPGSGLTNELIRQIIDFEIRDTVKQRLYFFDFDNLLSLLGGLRFATPPFTNPSADDHAHFLFSDHVQKSDDPNDRLTLLKEMFKLIGPERCYIITCNAAAVKKNPNNTDFFNILRVLLPNLNPDNVRNGNRKDMTTNDIKPDKGFHIIDLINKKVGQIPPKGGVKRRRPTVKRLKTRNASGTKYQRNKITRKRLRNKYRK